MINRNKIDVERLKRAFERIKRTLAVGKIIHVKYITKEVT